MSEVKKTASETARPKKTSTAAKPAPKSTPKTTGSKDAGTAPASAGTGSTDSKKAAPKENTAGATPGPRQLPSKSDGFEKSSELRETDSKEPGATNILVSSLEGAWSEPTLGENLEPGPESLRNSLESGQLGLDPKERVTGSELAEARAEGDTVLLDREQSVADYKTAEAATAGQIDSYASAEGHGPHHEPLVAIREGHRQAQQDKAETVDGLADELTRAGYSPEDARQKAESAVGSEKELYKTFDTLYRRGDERTRERLEELNPQLARLAQKEEQGTLRSDEEYRRDLEEQGDRFLPGLGKSLAESKIRQAEATRESIAPDTDKALLAPTQDAKAEIRERAQADPNGTWLFEAFEGKLTREQARQLNEAFARGEIPIPDRIEYVDPEQLDGNNARFYESGEESVLQISRALEGDPEAVRDALVEEWGHFIDSTLERGDTDGDEGAFFLEAVETGTVSEATRAREQEDTHLEVIDGELVQVENQQAPLSSPPPTQVADAPVRAEPNDSVVTIKPTGSTSGAPLSGGIDRPAASPPAGGERSTGPAQVTAASPTRDASAGSSLSGVSSQPGGAPLAQLEEAGEVFWQLSQTMSGLEEATELLQSLEALPEDLGELENLPQGLAGLDSQGAAALQELPGLLDQLQQLRRSLDKLGSLPKLLASLGSLPSKLARSAGPSEEAGRVTDLSRALLRPELARTLDTLDQLPRLTGRLEDLGGRAVDKGATTLHGFTDQATNRPQRLDRVERLAGILRSAQDNPESLRGMARLPGLVGLVDEGLRGEELKSLLRGVRARPGTLGGLERLIDMIHTTRRNPQTLGRLRELKGGVEQFRQAVSTLAQPGAVEGLGKLSGLMREARRQPVFPGEPSRAEAPESVRPTQVSAQGDDFEALARVLTGRRADSRLAQAVLKTRAVSAPSSPSVAAPTPEPQANLKGPLGAHRLKAFRHAYGLIRDITIGKSTRNHPWSLAHMSRRSDDVHAVADAFEATVVEAPDRMVDLLNRTAPSPQARLALGTTLANLAETSPERLVGTLLLTTDAAGGSQAVAKLFESLGRDSDASHTLGRLFKSGTQSPTAARGMGELLETLTAFDSETHWDRSRQLARGLAETTRYVGGSRDVGQGLVNSLEAAGGARGFSQWFGRLTRTAQGALAASEIFQNLTFDRGGARGVAGVLARASMSAAGSRDLLASFQRMASSDVGKRRVSGLLVRVAEFSHGARLMNNLVQSDGQADQLARLFHQLAASEVAGERVGMALEAMSSNPGTSPEMESFFSRAAAHENLSASLARLGSKVQAPPAGGDEAGDLRRSESLSLAGMVRSTQSQSGVGVDLAWDASSGNGSWPQVAWGSALTEGWERLVFPSSDSKSGRGELPTSTPFRPGDVYSEDSLFLARICPECGSRTSSGGDCPHCAMVDRISRLTA